jgi:phosphatidate cytidylyltransferase
MARSAAPEPRRRGDLGLRFLSAVVVGPLVLAAEVAGGWAFAAVAVAICAAGAIEWERLTAAGRPVGTLATVALTVLPGLFLEATGSLPPALGSLVAVFVAGAVVRRGGPGSLLAAAGPAYLGAAAFAVIWLRTLPSGATGPVLWLLLVVWATDIGGYTAGRAIGGPKLAPRLSPAKTWAGAAGALTFAMAVGLVMARVVPGPGIAAAIALAAALSVTAQIGDLFESWLKRRCGAKDSGGMMPGHGGVLDRIDGLVAASLAMAAMVAGFGPALGWS